MPETPVKKQKRRTTILVTGPQSKKTIVNDESIKEDEENQATLQDNETCVQTFHGHAQNFSSECFHPKLPLIITGTKDSTVKFWNSDTYILSEKKSRGWRGGWGR